MCHDLKKMAILFSHCHFLMMNLVVVATSPHVVSLQALVVAHTVVVVQSVIDAQYVVVRVYLVFELHPIQARVQYHSLLTPVDYHYLVNGPK